MGGPGSGKKPKTYDPQTVAEVTKRYAAGQTQSEIAAAIGLTQKIVWNLMRRHGVAARIAAKREQSGTSNPMWKGVDAGYQALHLRVAKLRGTPNECGRCGSAGQSGTTYEWANLSGRYDDPYDYERMCRSCHRRYDAARRG